MLTPIMSTLAMAVRADYFTFLNLSKYNSYGSVFRDHRANRRPLNPANMIEVHHPRRVCFTTISAWLVFILADDFLNSLALFLLSRIISVNQPLVIRTIVRLIIGAHASPASPPTLPCSIASCGKLGQLFRQTATRTDDWSGREDLNLHFPHPKCGGLPLPYVPY